MNYYPGLTENFKLWIENFIEKIGLTKFQALLVVSLLITGTFFTLFAHISIFKLGLILNHNKIHHF